MTDSTEILKYLETFAKEDAKLYPDDPRLLKQVEELEALFNQKLGTATRVWAYSYTLHHPKLALSRFTYKVPFHERVLFPVVFPVVNSMIRRQLNVTDEAATNAHAQVTRIFEEVGKKLDDGRAYLGGKVAKLSSAAM